MIMKFLVFIFIIVGVLILLDKLTKSPTDYEEWIKKEVERSPSYLYWLHNVNRKKEYNIGLKHLKNIEKNKKGGEKK